MLDNELVEIDAVLGKISGRARKTCANRHIGKRNRYECRVHTGTHFGFSSGVAGAGLIGRSGHCRKERKLRNAEGLLHDLREAGTYAEGFPSRN